MALCSSFRSVLSRIMRTGFEKAAAITAALPYFLRVLAEADRFAPCSASSISSTSSYRRLRQSR